MLHNNSKHNCSGISMTCIYSISSIIIMRRWWCFIFLFSSISLRCIGFWIYVCNTSLTDGSQHVNDNNNTNINVMTLSSGNLTPYNLLVHFIRLRMGMKGQLCDFPVTRISLYAVSPISSDISERVYFLQDMGALCRYGRDAFPAFQWEGVHIMSIAQGHSLLDCVDKHSHR